MKKILLTIAALAALASGQASADAVYGASLYNSDCAGCHGNLTSTWATSAATIQNAIQRNRGGMGRLSTLSATDLQDLADYMNNPAAATASTGTTTGATTGTTTGTATGTTTTGTTAGTTTGTSTGTTAGTTAPTSTAAVTPDTLFAALETAFPTYFGTHDATLTIGGYSIRYYPTTNLYLGILGNQLYFYNDSLPAQGIVSLGTASGVSTALASPATSTAFGTQLAAILAGKSTTTAGKGGKHDGDDGDNDHDGNEHDGSDNDGQDNHHGKNGHDD